MKKPNRDIPIETTYQEYFQFEKQKIDNPHLHVEELQGQRISAFWKTLDRRSFDPIYLTHSTYLSTPESTFDRPAVELLIAKQGLFRASNHKRFFVNPESHLTPVRDKEWIIDNKFRGFHILEGFVVLDIDKSPSHVKELDEKVPIAA